MSADADMSSSCLSECMTVELLACQFLTCKGQCEQNVTQVDISSQQASQVETVTSEHTSRVTNCLTLLSAPRMVLHLGRASTGPGHGTANRACCACM